VEFYTFLVIAGKWGSSGEASSRWGQRDLPRSSAIFWILLQK